MKEPFKFTEEDKRRIEANSDLRIDSDIYPMIEQLISSREGVEGGEAVRGDISVADLRKLFAHRASRITEDTNQGANQLMTLTDFRLAVADMGWRIGFDKIAKLESELTALRSAMSENEKRIAELEAIVDQRSSNSLTK